MIDPPQIVQTTAQIAAALRLTVPGNEIQNVMGPGLGEVLGAVQSQGHESAGPWFTHHLKIEPGVFDFEICVPLAAAIVAVGRVSCLTIPELHAARTIYRGPYEGLAAAWGEFDAWIRSSGFTPAPDLYECYEAGPESSPDPSQWRTELTRPLV